MKAIARFFSLAAAVLLAGHAPPAFSCLLALSPAPDWLDSSDADDDIERHYFHERFIYRIETKKLQAAKEIYVWTAEAEKPHVFVAHADNILSLNRFLECMGGAGPAP